MPGQVYTCLVYHRCRPDRVSPPLVGTPRGGLHVRPKDPVDRCGAELVLCPLSTLSSRCRPGSLGGRACSFTLCLQGGVPVSVALCLLGR